MRRVGIGLLVLFKGAIILSTMSERVVVLTILKIFNWNLNQTSPLFEFAFFSLKTNCPIVSKTIRATCQQQ